jgi:hypothetical protein
MPTFFLRLSIILFIIRAFLLPPTAYDDWVRHAFTVVTHLP